jgi:predicted nuclease of predicted toxin-antitoxin system
VDLLPGGKGFTAVHWSTVGQPSAADSEIFDFAAANDWIVFTHDLDFGMLLVTLRTSRPSVIQVRAQDVLPSAIGDIVLRASKPLNQTSKPALSLPWTPFVTAFGYCLSEGIEGLPQSSRTASLQFASRLPPMQRGCSRRSARPTALLENRRISSPDPCGQEPIASRISGRVGNFDLALRRSILRGTLDVVDDQRLNRSPYRFQSEAELLRNRSEKAGLGGIVGGPS